MNVNEITCLGVDGKLYQIQRFTEVSYQNDIPVGYLIPDFPKVKLIARSFSYSDLNEHPLRKAFFKFWAAKEHNIVEKQRPQDVTIDEALQMVKDYLLSENFDENEIEEILNKYWKN